MAPGIAQAWRQPHRARHRDVASNLASHAEAAQAADSSSALPKRIHFAQHARVRRIDQRFARLAKKLTWLELRRPDDDDSDVLAGAAQDPGDEMSPRGRAFVDTYSVQGLRTVIEHYGLQAKLEERGLADYELVVTEEDPFHHRLELLLRGAVPDGADRRIMDLRLHLGRLASPHEASAAAFEVVVVEWLLMQNPRGAFTRARPRLPGQRHPGTGLGSDVAQLLVLMCRRIGRAGLVVVPERFHLAELYARGGWLAASARGDRLIDELKLAAPTLSFAARAWAMERGCVIDEEGAPVVYAAEERVLPVAAELESAFTPGSPATWLRALLEPRRRLRVDRERLAASLRSDPVEGMDPAQLDS